MEVAGLEAGTGIISTAFAKDPTDPAWSEDRGVKDWRDFMSKYAPEGDIRDQSAVYAFRRQAMGAFRGDLDGELTRLPI
jgi:branched-chain amino acid transport system substrate-binding protein